MVSYCRRTVVFGHWTESKNIKTIKYDGFFIVVLTFTLISELTVEVDSYFKVRKTAIAKILVVRVHKASKGQQTHLLRKINHN